MGKTIINHISRLARLELTEAETIKVQADFENILRYMDVLQEVDTDGVIPASHTSDMQNVFRKDQVTPSQPVGEVLANSSDSTEQYFRVPRAVEE